MSTIARLLVELGMDASGFTQGVAAAQAVKAMTESIPAESNRLFELIFMDRNSATIR